MESRTHLVFVPGFVGFDALGQLEYYAGVTRVFEQWCRSSKRAVTLHYFDNFPTASVALRAERLRSYLLKRVARGEFVKGDRVSLVGHSTGGLDIRRAVFDLAEEQNDVAEVDAGSTARHGELLEYLQHLVFLSVPHYGTNLADFAWKIGDSVQGVLSDAAFALWFNREPLATLRRHIEEFVINGSSDLLLAIADALNESDESVVKGEARDLAGEREARAQLGLWLEHMSKDFSVIGDLRSASGGPTNSTSPAHFTETQRAEEMRVWADHGISTRTYASMVTKRPDLAQKVPSLLARLIKTGASGVNQVSKVVNSAADAWWLPPVSVGARAARVVAPALSVPVLLTIIRSHPDAVFKLFHALCADPTGPFEVDAASIAPDVELFGTQQTRQTSTIGNDDSDGVVNTRSMLWPYDRSNPNRHPRFLIEADHADVNGHYQRRPKSDPQPRGRAYDAYDLFPSGSQFTERQFDALWIDVFNSCP